MGLEKIAVLLSSCVTFDLVLPYIFGAAVAEDVQRVNHSSQGMWFNPWLVRPLLCMAVNVPLLCEWFSWRPVVQCYINEINLAFM